MRHTLVDRPELFVSLQQKLTIEFEIELVFNNGAHEVVLIARKLS